MSRPSHVLLALAVLAPAALPDCVLAWPTGVHVSDYWGPSYINSNPTFALDREVSDDFDFTGPITRLYVSGYNGGPTGSATPIDGVWVRFYEWTPSGPGALQRATFVAGNDPAVGVEPRPSGVDVQLTTPFVATGRHFVSVQLDFTDYGYWTPWQVNLNTPRLSTGWVRTNGGAWGLFTPLFSTQPLMADVDFVLYTDAATPCAPWSQVVVPAPNDDSGLVDVEVISASEVWALGNKSVTTGSTLESFPFALRLNGTTWSVVDLPPTPPLGTIGSRSTMEAIEAVGPNDIWAAGARFMVVPGGWVGHQIRADHFDGTTWTTMDTPLPTTSGSAGYSGSRIADIKAFASNDVWFVGEWVGPYPGVVGTQPALAMHWDGSSFTLVPTPPATITGGSGLDAIDGIAPNDVWAVGGGGDGDLISASYVVRWNGSTWTQVPAPSVGLMQRLNDVVAISSNDVWSAGEALSNNQYVGFVQHWDGVSWSNVANAPTSFAASFHANGANDLWLGAWHWNGSIWSYEATAGCDPWAFRGRLGGGGGRLFAVGSALLPGRVPYVVERTSNCTSGTYCTSSTSSHGCVATIEGIGTASASASSGFTIRVDHVEGQRSGLIFYSTSGPQALPWSAGSTSFLCVKLPTQRMGTLNSGGTSGACDGVLAQDWNAFMSAHSGALGSPRFLGQRFDAQAWFRDPPAPKSTQLSNALEFTLQP